MDNAVNLLLREGTLALGALVFIATFLVRRICETGVPTLKMQAHENDPQASYATTMSMWWNKVILYVIPPALGGLAGIAQIPYVFPDDKFTTMGGRIVFGIVVGWFSSLLYKVIRMAVAKKTGIQLPSNSIPPDLPS